MEKQIELLDCTLRDGAYITESRFGAPAIKGIIKNMQDAGVEIIECGWLKDKEHEYGTSFYHVPSDLEQYLLKKDDNITYVVMIDWDRYDTSYLPQYDGRSIDAIRVVFPHGKFREGIEVGKRIRDKGYKVYFQAANTLAYSDDDLEKLADAMNGFGPRALSIVDTFGAMFEDDLDRICDKLDGLLNPEIRLGFHSHNNQQLAFALSMHFVKRCVDSGRQCIVDATLCGMGRGAGNATTELMTSYLNRKQHGNYDLDAVMDAIDKYMQEFLEKYEWGYSTPYFIAGMYQCHVNNIAYLLNNHRTNSKDMRNIIESLSQDDRRKYDYNLLEEKYIENQDRIVDDEQVMEELKSRFMERPVLLLCPGASLKEKQQDVESFIADNNPVIIGVNAIVQPYSYDYLFFVNHARYEYAKEAYTEQFNNTWKILLSNIKSEPDDMEKIINFNSVTKRGWKYFDNPAICCLRLMNRLGVADIYIAGFDSFKTKYNESYADSSLPSVGPEGFDELNRELLDMYKDFKMTSGLNSNVCFVTDSIFDV